MLLYLLSMAVGFALLIWGADRFVIGAGATARNLGVPPLIVGLTVVAFATSAPEMFVSVTAALQGLPGIAVGNAIGSNIANVGLVLGVTAMVRTITVRSETLRREIALLTAITALAFIAFVDDALSRADGLLMIAGLGIFMYWITMVAFRIRGADPIEAQYAAEIPADMKLDRGIAWLVAGLIVLLLGARALVWGGENLARVWGVSELLIGVTIVAVGTSLPELAVCIVSVRKGEYGLALGNVIGSNVFNLLAVVGLAAAISPLQFGPEVAEFHYSIMVLFTVALMFLAYNYFGTGIGRRAGLALVAGFFAYHGYLAYTNI